MTAFDINDTKRRMEGALQALKNEFAGLRAGRANTALLDPVQVEAYGSFMPLNQVATVGAPESRLLTVQVWDKGMVKAVEKAIAASGLGLNPQADGTLIRVPLPELSEDRRKEMVKIAHKYAEEGKIAIRNIRRDAMDKLKKMEKDKEISEDEHKGHSDKVQKTTDEHVKKVDEMLAAKEKEVLTV